MAEGGFRGIKRSHSQSAKPNKAKRQNDEFGFPKSTRSYDRLDLDTANLLFITTKLKFTSKKLNDFKAKIIRKRDKKKSKQLKDCEETYERLHEELLDDLKDLKKLLPEEIYVLEETQDHKQKSFGETQCRDCHERQLKIWKLEKEKEKLEKQVDKVKVPLKDESKAEEDVIKRLKGQVDDLEMRLKKEVDAKDDAVRRLSELASSKLRDNNPNVVDLSDQNRPTKLAEQVSEIYDSEWTEAFDELEKDNLTEEDIVRRLRNAFMDVYAECKRITSNGYFRKVRRCINQTDIMMTTKMDKEEQNDENNSLPDQLKQQIKEFRKLDAKSNMKTIVQGLLSQSRLKYLQDTPFSRGCARIYVKRCIEVSWLMCVQDPPLLLSVDTDKKFNGNLFREYTKRGPYVTYVVWPVLYLHKNGPVLSKGVAQGTRDM